MAEKNSTKHRKVKNPETFREKAIKATEDSSKESFFRKNTIKLLKGILVPFKKASKWLAGTRLFKLIWKIIRKPVRIIGLILLPRYIRNSWKELKLVTWPDFKTSRKLTSAVIVFAIIFGVVVAIVDLVFNKLFKNILLK